MFQSIIYITKNYQIWEQKILATKFGFVPDCLLGMWLLVIHAGIEVNPC